MFIKNFIKIFFKYLLIFILFSMLDTIVLEIYFENFINYLDMDLYRNYVNSNDSNIVISSNNQKTNLVTNEDLYNEEFEDLFVDPEMINYYINGPNFGNNYNVPEIKITFAEDLNNLQNSDNIIQNINSEISSNNNPTILENNINRSTFSIDEGNIHVEKSYKLYYIISGILFSGTIITVITVLLTK